VSGSIGESLTLGNGGNTLETEARLPLHAEADGCNAFDILVAKMPAVIPSTAAGHLYCSSACTAAIKCAQLNAPLPTPRPELRLPQPRKLVSTISTNRLENSGEQMAQFQAAASTNNVSAQETVAADVCEASCFEACVFALAGGTRRRCNRVPDSHTICSPTQVLPAN